jgi:hypothetical protein
VPLCRNHHEELHRYGNEATWWANVQIAPIAVAKELWTATLFQQDRSIGMTDAGRGSTKGGSLPRPARCQSRRGPLGRTDFLLRDQELRPLIMEEVYRAPFGGDAATDRDLHRAAAFSKLEVRFTWSDTGQPGPANKRLDANKNPPSDRSRRKGDFVTFVRRKLLVEHRSRCRRRWIPKCIAQRSEHRQTPFDKRGIGNP